MRKGMVVEQEKKGRKKRHSRERITYAIVYGNYFFSFGWTNAMVGILRTNSHRCLRHNIEFHWKKREIEFEFSLNCIGIKTTHKKKKEKDNKC